MPGCLVVQDISTSARRRCPRSAAARTEVIEGGYPEIVWEHSHVVVNDDGKVMTYCVYEAPDEDTVRNHAVDLGETHGRRSPRDRR